MPKPPRRPPQLRGKIFRGTHARRIGLLTKNDLRSTAWRSLFRDVYADAALPDTHALRSWAASAYLLPEGAAVAGRSAADLFGVHLVGDGKPVEVRTPYGFGPVNGLRIRRGPLDPADVVRCRDARVTSPARTCWDLARWLPTIEAVVYLDALLGRRVLTPAQLNAYLGEHYGDVGWARVAKAVGLADPAAESPQESRLRVRLVLAGFPPPVSQYILAVEGVFVARFDLAWPDYRIAVEYDGAWHADHAQLEKDRARLNRILGAGWLVLHVTAARLRDDFAGVVRELRAAMRRAA
jgi:hypothetical protein